MTDGNMHYFSGELYRRGPECSIFSVYAGLAAQRKGHFFKGDCVTMNHDLLSLSVCISSWQQHRRTSADV